MDRIGYVLSEIPVLFFVIWFAFRLVQYRRYRRNQPIYSDKDRQLLFSRTKTTLEPPVFSSRASSSHSRGYGGDLSRDPYARTFRRRYPEHRARAHERRHRPLVFGVRYIVFLDFSRKRICAPCSTCST